MLQNLLHACRDRWANLHPLFRFIGIATLLGATGLLVLKPAYRTFKLWRLEQNLVAAKEAVDEVRMYEARDLSLTVLRAGDPRIEAIRILETSMASLRDPRHAEIARALISHPDGSDADRLNAFRGMVGETPLGLLGQAWAALPENCQTHPGFAVLFAGRLISAGRYGEAATVLLAVPEQEKNVAVEQGLIRVLVGSGKSEGYDEAQRRLAGLWPATMDPADGWLDLLEELPVLVLRPELLLPLRKGLESPDAPHPDRRALALARIDYVANYSGRAEVLETTISRWKDQSPVAVAGFLSDLGLHRLVLETFPEASLVDQPGLLPLVLEAMRLTDAWDRMTPLLEVNANQLPESKRLAYRSLVAGKTGDPVAQAQEWKAAMGEAISGTSSNPYLDLHDFARDAGMEVEAAQAMLEAVRVGRGRLPLYSDLKFLLSQLAVQGRENDLLGVCAIYLLFEPGNPVLLTQYAYLACLNALAEPAVILKAIRPVADAFPDTLPIQCVLATAYLSAGNPAAAAETLDRLKLDPATLSPGYRAAFLVTQVLNQRLPKNDPAIVDLPWNVLLPSERRRFGEWIKLTEPSTDGPSQ